MQNYLSILLLNNHKYLPGVYDIAISAIKIDINSQIKNR